MVFYGTCLKGFNGFNNINGIKGFNNTLTN